MISKAFSSNVDRNLIEISPDNKITTMVAYTSEYKEKVANPDYTYSYVGKVFKINFNFSSQGEGEARNALIKYENNEKCDVLRPIFDVMEDSKMNIKRGNWIFSPRHTIPTSAITVPRWQVWVSPPPLQVKKS